MAPGPIIVLWTVPRSVSTAFERMMMERGDVAVVHEPYSLRYYFGPDKRSNRYERTDPTGTPDRIIASLAHRASDGPVFVKDMAYHVRDLVDPHFVARFTNTFLIRDPAWTIPSLARHWPDFTLEEVGYDALEELLDAGGDSIVIDSDDLRADPEGIVRAYCEAVDLPFVTHALEWEPGMPAQWGTWEAWHRDVAESSGFASPPEGPPPPLPDAPAKAAYDHCAPIYERLRSRSIPPRRNTRGAHAGGP
jgi:hypothetical protein